jgi:hypothetical protein
MAAGQVRSGRLPRKAAGPTQQSVWHKEDDEHDLLVAVAPDASRLAFLKVHEVWPMLWTLWLAFTASV